MLAGCTTIVASRAKGSVGAIDTRENHKITNEDLVGRYYLAGVMETASGLQLNSDGGFNWYLSVGSLDVFHDGTWSADQTSVTLMFDPARTGADYPAIGEKVLQISGRNLKPDMEMGGTYFRAQPNEPTN